MQGGPTTLVRKVNRPASIRKLWPALLENTSVPPKRATTATRRTTEDQQRPAVVSCRHSKVPTPPQRGKEGKVQRAVPDKGPAAMPCRSDC